MSTNFKKSKHENYFSGGLAEIVSSPSDLTYSFLADWFTGNGSLGKAMKLLGIPYQELQTPIFEIKNNELLVNLNVEELTFYQKTIFEYKKQIDIHKTPELIINIAKCFNITNLINTLQILLIQSKWIADPKKTIEAARGLVESIPDYSSGTTLQEVDELLEIKVWPNLIAIGLMSEFYNQLLLKEAKEDLTAVNDYISREVVINDWFFLSIADQSKVKNNKLSFTNYIEKYGLRADKDYELTSPRWYEIQDIIKKRIEKSTQNKESKVNSLNINKKLKTLVEAIIALQLLRSESKRKALIHINQLRKIILRNTNGLTDISQITKENLLAGKYQQKKQINNISKQKRSKKILHTQSGRGASVSGGNAIGLVMNITDNEVIVPKGTIGIFPNASPEFAVQFPKCTGMIFLKGGQTSHGAIVAREFKIPAIVDSNAQGILNDSKVQLNAETGEWKIL